MPTDTPAPGPDDRPTAQMNTAPPDPSDQCPRCEGTGRYRRYGEPPNTPCWLCRGTGLMSVSVKSGDDDEPPSPAPGADVAGELADWCEMMSHEWGHEPVTSQRFGRIAALLRELKSWQDAAAKDCRCDGGPVNPHTYPDGLVWCGQCHRQYTGPKA